MSGRLRSAALRGLGAGAAAGALLALYEAVDLFVFSRELFVTTKEMLRWLVGAPLLAGGAAAVCGAVAGLLAALVDAWLVPGKVDPATAARRRAAVLAGLAIPVAIAIALLAFLGPQASRLSWRRGAQIAFVVLCDAGVYGVAWLVVREYAAGRGRRLRIAVVLALASVSFSAVDHHVLVRLYGWFHDGLLALSLVLGGAAAAAFVPWPWPWPRPWPAASGRRRAIAAAACVLALFAGGWLLSTENLRFIASERAPAVAWAARPLGRLARLVRRAPNEAEEPALALEEPAGAPSGPGPMARLEVTGADVVLVTIDALRADHVGAYGYGRPVTPNLDRLAAEGVVFVRAYSPIPHTSYGVASLLTGKYVRPLFDLAGTDGRHETIAEVLRRYRYETAAFFPPAIFYIDRPRFRAFEDAGYGFVYVKYEYLAADRRVDQALDYLRARSPGERVFLWVHLFEPHEPYEAHAGFDFGARAIDRYDGEINFSDAQLGRLLAEVGRVRPRSIIVVTGDHGEEFGEHGGHYHGTSLYDEQIRVPLVVHVPGLAARRVTEPVNLVDVAGTVLRLLGVPVDPRVRSRDLSAFLAGLPAPPGETFAEIDRERMIVRGHDKLICDASLDLCRLYDLEHDPAERRNRAEEDPARVSDLRRRLRAFVASHARWERAALPVAGAGTGGEGSPSWPEPVRRALAGDPEAAPALLELLDPRDTPLRRVAAQALARIVSMPMSDPSGGEGSATVQALRRARLDTDAEVAAWASIGLARAGEPTALGSLRALLDRPAPVGREAALVLGVHRDPAARTALERIVDDEQSPIEARLEAVAWLGELSDARSVGALVRALSVLRLRGGAARALGRLCAGLPSGSAGRDRAVLALRAALRSETYVNFMEAEVEALGRIGDGRAVADLWPLIGSAEPVAGVVEALRKTGALVGMRGRDLVRRPVAGSGWRCDDPPAVGCAPSGEASLLLPDALRAERVAIRVVGESTGGSLRLAINDVPLDPIPVVAGATEVVRIVATGAWRRTNNRLWIVAEGSPDVRLSAVAWFSSPARSVEVR